MWVAGESLVAAVAGENGFDTLRGEGASQRQGWNDRAIGKRFVVMRSGEGELPCCRFGGDADDAVGEAQVASYKSRAGELGFIAVEDYGEGFGECS